MSYTPGIPQADDNPSDSQVQMLNNFRAINRVNSVNHSAFNSSDEGKHKFLQMPRQTNDPVTAPEEAALYTKESGNRTQLFYRDESNGTVWQMTGQFVQNFDIPGVIRGYYTLPGGLLLNWLKLDTMNGSRTIEFAKAFSEPPWNITLGNGSTVPTVISYFGETATQVTLRGATPAVISCLAIGPTDSP